MSGTGYRAMVEQQARRTLGELGFRPTRLEWLSGTTFQAAFRSDADASGLAGRLRGLGRTASARPARFDDPAFVTFVL